MGGKNQPDNSAVVQEQQNEAAQEAAKEAERQKRINTGLASIKAAFEGSPVMASQNYDWSNFRAPQTMPAAMSTWLAANPKETAPDFSQTGSVPAGYTAVQVAPRSGTAASKTTGGTGASGFGVLDPTLNKGSKTSSMAGWDQLDPLMGVGGKGYGDWSQLDPGAAGMSGGSSAGGGGSVWALKDANGKIYYQGDPLTYEADTGKTTGGFDDAFYNKYKQSVLDYYMPQVDKQYSDAKKQATFGLARSGNLLSSAANDLTADLSQQNDVNVAGVRNQADTAAGDLRSQVNTEKQKAVSQLYATEDPEVSSQQALASVRDLSLSQPDMSPLSALFNVATIGGANIMKGYQGQQNLNAFTSGLPKDKGTVIRS